MNETKSERGLVSKPVEDADAVIIALTSRRYVIVHRDGATRLRSAEQLCRPLHRLRPGEMVYYKGRRDEVRAITAY